MRAAIAPFRLEHINRTDALPETSCRMTAIARLVGREVELRRRSPHRHDRFDQDGADGACSSRLRPVRFQRSEHRLQRSVHDFRTVVRPSRNRTTDGFELFRSQVFSFERREESFGCRTIIGVTTTGFHAICF